MIDASVVGYGVVGKATARIFGIEKYYDIEGSTATLRDCAQTSFVFICLPSPTKEKGGQDLVAIRGVVQIISGYRRTPVIVIRSTVLPGTARWIAEKYRMETVAWPEFGSEDTMEQDMRWPHLVAIGSDNVQTGKMVLEKYEQAIGGFKCPVVFGNSATAEVLKYACNSFFATKVTFANLIYDICRGQGADYEQIKSKVFEKHQWFGSHHWEIWHKGYRGFGGKCFPKDVKAFLGYKYNPLLKAILQMNEDFGDKKKDE